MLTAVAVFALNKLDARRKDLPEVMPTREELEAGAVDRESVGASRDENGDADLLDPVQMVALAVVVYLALVFGFATLGG